MQILDGFFRVKPENIVFATCMQNIELRFASSDIFHTCSSSDIFRYHPQAIQYCIKLGHKYPLTTPFMSHDQIGVRGHVGVTGTKKVIFTENTTPTDNVA